MFSLLFIWECKRCASYPEQIIIDRKSYNFFYQALSAEEYCPYIPVNALQLRRFFAQCVAADGKFEAPERPPGNPQFEFPVAFT